MPAAPRKNLVLFASGSGSNVENIARYFEGDSRIRIAAVFCNNFRAGVLDRCRRLGLPAYAFNRAAFDRPSELAGILKSFSPDLIVLAGFLWRIPGSVVQAFPGQIVNIHPALLPKYGGKGMYGMNVHKAVLENGEHETGITIHYVNEAYDEGAILFQDSVAIGPGLSPEEVAERVHELEYRHFPQIIESLILPANG